MGVRAMIRKFARCIFPCREVLWLTARFVGTASCSRNSDQAMAHSTGGCMVLFARTMGKRSYTTSTTARAID